MKQKTNIQQRKINNKKCFFKRPTEFINPYETDEERSEKACMTNTRNGKRTIMKESTRIKNNKITF